MRHYTAASVSRTSVRALAAVLVLAPVAPRALDGKVGPEACRACHPSAYDAWRATPHARALESLPERSRKDARCLSCHAPDLADGLSGVSCEACHGGGRVYEAPYVMRDPELARAVGLVVPGERGCLACHTDTTPSLERFDYARKRRLVAHGREPAPTKPTRTAPPARPAGSTRPTRPTGER